MNFDEAFFILQHGSYEGRVKYLESIQVVREHFKCLADENRELKKLLKLVIEDFERVTKMCVGYVCDNCPNNYSGGCPNDYGDNCVWQYKDEVEKLLKGGEENAEIH